MISEMKTKLQVAQGRIYSNEKTLKKTRKIIRKVRMT